MIGVLVCFDFPSGVDAAAVRAIAQRARVKFAAMPGLRSKTFTLNRARDQAINFYIWDDERAARAFFTPEFSDSVAAIYGAAPTISFVEIAALVDNAH
jgi:hypothetical protein